MATHSLRLSSCPMCIRSCLCSNAGCWAPITARSRTNIWTTASTSSPSGSTDAARAAAASCSFASFSTPSPSIRPPTSRWSDTPECRDLATTTCWGHLNEVNSQLLRYSPVDGRTPSCKRSSGLLRGRRRAPMCCRSLSLRVWWRRRSASHGGRENRADHFRLVRTGLRAMLIRSTSARHRIRHGIRHMRIGDSGRSGRLGIPQLRPAVRARPARRGGPCGSRPRAR